MYVSSGRGRKKSGIPVEPDAVLKVGDIVRIKDEKWFDSLETMDCIHNFGYIYYGNTSVAVTPTMTQYLGCTVEITMQADFVHYTGYKVKLANGDSREIEGYLFTNEMLEYI